MPVREIRLIGDPILTTPAKPVVAVDSEIRKMLDDMVDTMVAAQGIGLAAPQVGVGLRCIVVAVDPGKVYRMVDPVVSNARGLARGKEACLSVPGRSGKVTRPAWIQVTYQDERGQPQSLEASGLLARCIQHEVDHLDGILFVHRLGD